LVAFTSLFRDDLETKKNKEFAMPRLGASFGGIALGLCFLASQFAFAVAQAEDTVPKTDQKTDSSNSKKGVKKMTAPAQNPVVVMETSYGTIEIELFADKAPISTENFLKYVDDGFFSGTIFHRVIADFMIQGGGFTEDMNQKKTRDSIKNEATNGLKNERGTLAMARTMVVDSATAQFFINVKDNPFLNNRGTDMQSYGYAVFGKVVSGMDIVDKIRAVKTGSKKGMDDVPETAVLIKSAKRK
jgi:cyclophilin family peptidyl-prolyl cis-trans isomerase